MNNSIKDLNKILETKQNNLLKISEEFINIIEIFKSVLKPSIINNDSFEDLHYENNKIDKNMIKIGRNVSNLVDIINKDKKDIENIFKDNDTLNLEIKSNVNINKKIINKVNKKLINQQIEKLKNIK